MISCSIQEQVVDEVEQVNILYFRRCKDGQEASCPVKRRAQG